MQTGFLGSPRMNVRNSAWLRLHNSMSIASKSSRTGRALSEGGAQRVARPLIMLTSEALGTVSWVRRKASLSRHAHNEPVHPVRRYLREHLGELINLAIKTLVRFTRVGHHISRDRTGRSIN